MFDTVKRLIAFVSMCGPLLAVAPASAEPALWAVRSAQSTIYLFGTIHMLKSDMDWQSPKITRAFAESGDLWLELTDDDAGAMQPLVTKLGLDPTHPLSSRLSPADLARVDAAAKTAGIPFGERTLDPMRPWLASVSLAAGPMLQAGFDPASGADHVLKQEALDAGKSLNAFETAEKQMHFFADLPPKEELLLLTSTLDDVAEGPGKIEEMAKAWQDGNVASISKLFVDFKEPKYRALYKVLLVDRNQAWAARLQDRLKTGHGTSFVAVGAGHLAGPDSLIVQLERRGIKVERQ